MHNNLGVAVDIGTTTVAVMLADTDTGKLLGTAGGMNAQAAYGADVTARITYCMNNDFNKLTELIREQIDMYIRKLCRDAASGPLNCDNINNVIIAGNTVMQHLSAGYSPVSMGTAPYTPLSLFGHSLPAWDTLPVNKKADVFYTPAISSYVGGDITAGLLAAGFEHINTPALLIDIGTNGEMVLKHNGTYYCCATAAGPAFEGAEITKGMAALAGAVDHVWIDNGGKLKFSTIDNAVPLGICGSGLLDFLAALLDNGSVDETGRLIIANTQDGNSGKYCLPGKPDIYLTASDIRKLQLAKAAIAGGIQVLLHYAGIKETDITLLALAGGFGTYLRPESAARIGLFPQALLPAAKAMGNTAGEGAVMALRYPDARQRMTDICKRCEYIELSSNAFFNDMFTDALMMCSFP